MQKKYVKIASELFLMAIVILLPFSIPLLTPINYLKFPYYIQQLIYAFSVIPSLIIFFLLVPPRSISQALGRYGIIPFSIKDILIGICYGVGGLMVIIILYMSVFRPLGFIGHLPYDEKSIGQNQFDFLFLTFKTGMVVLFEEIIFRAYLNDRISQKIRSPIWAGGLLLSIFIVYLAIFFQNNFSWVFIAIAGVSIVVYLRGKKLIRSVASNLFILMILYAIAMHH
jgi:hypothetical protein